MTKTLLIGRKNPGEKNDVEILAQRLSSIGGHVEHAYFEEIVLEISNEKQHISIIGDAEKSLTDYERVVQLGWSHDKLYSDLAHAIALIAHRSSIEVWNTELISARSMTKVSQMVRAVGIDLPIAATTFSLTKEYAINRINSFPIIAKDPLASRGRRNFLIQNKNEVEKLSSENFPLLFQDYIKNDSSDIRVIVAGGQPALAFRRLGNPGSHLNNTSTGANAELIQNIPDDLAELSSRVAGHFQRELCGIDFIVDTENKQYIFLEVNATPQLVSGVFVEQKMAALAKALEIRKD